MGTIKKAMTLLSKAGIQGELYQEMIYNFTKGRTRSVKDLSDKELDDFCKELESRFTASDFELEMKRKRSVVLTLATRTGIKEADSWSKFNTWMKNKSIFKKELYAYDYDELDQLIRQFRGLESNYKNSAKKAGTKAWHHATGIPKPSEN
jgi:hypothetical protein